MSYLLFIVYQLNKMWFNNVPEVLQEYIVCDNETYFEPLILFRLCNFVIVYKLLYFCNSIQIICI